MLNSPPLKSQWLGNVLIKKEKTIKPPSVDRMVTRWQPGSSTGKEDGVV